jgi:hypothetical protein
MTNRLKAALRVLLRGAPEDDPLRDVQRRLRRIEGQLDQVNKIWQRIRHVEPAVQALLRERYLAGADLPYPERLLARRFRISSQNQEDGLTLALLLEAGTTNRRFVEIGSGLSGGNSGFLARDLGWTGLMVDGHTAHMEQVARRFPSVTAVAAWVTRENLGELITSHGFGGEIDFFSLDLDGNDYWLWESLTECRPRVVVLEYNSIYGPARSVTIPYDAQFDRHKHHTTYYGASLTALTRLSARKGYRLVAVEPTGVNAYFLRADVAPQVPAVEPARAYRLLEKYDLLIQEGHDIFRYAEKAGLPLVDVP